MMPCGGKFDGKMNVQSACALNTQYNISWFIEEMHFIYFEMEGNVLQGKHNNHMHF
jgi:hypothetical protein